MQPNVYSFENTSIILSHPNGGQFQFNGTGTGQAIVGRTGERTVHQVGADGVTMVSKVIVRNGQITIQVQQASLGHKFMQDLYNFLDVSDASEWALATILIQNPMLGITHTATGVSPQKVPDQDNQAQGQMISWVWMCAEIHTETI